jgi:hypothetical protein
MAHQPLEPRQRGYAEAALLIFRSWLVGAILVVATVPVIGVVVTELTFYETMFCTFARCDNFDFDRNPLTGRPER